MIPACTPFHEAGHALVAEHVGIEVLAVHVHEDGGWVDRGLFRNPDTARADAFPVMMAAGYAAELAYDPDPDRAWQHAAGDRARLHALGHSDSEILTCAREARAIIEAQRSAWEALAHILAGGGSFPGELVRSLLAGEPADGRMALAALEARREP
jgi:hypothetical protein